MISGIVAGFILGILAYRKGRRDAATRAADSDAKNYCDGFNHGVAHGKNIGAYR